MPAYGFNENQAREYLTRQVGKAAASSSFYWESEDVEEAVDMLIGAFSKLIAENNKKLVADWEREMRRRATTR